MSIRMKLANWLVGGHLEEQIGALEFSAKKIVSQTNQINTLLVQIENLMCDPDPEFEAMKAQLHEANGSETSLRTALKRIYDIPCTDKSSGSLKRARKIAAHALWRE